MLDARCESNATPRRVEIGIGYTWGLRVQLTDVQDRWPRLSLAEPRLVVRNNDSARYDTRRISDHPRDWAGLKVEHEEAMCRPTSTPDFEIPHSLLMQASGYAKNALTC